MKERLKQSKLNNVKMNKGKTQTRSLNRRIRGLKRRVLN